MTNNQTTLNDFIKEKELGSGTFGSVYLVRRKEDNQIYALKTVTFDKLNKREQENSLNEVRILASVNHPNVIGYKEAFWDDQKKSLNIVMEYADDGDLGSKISYMRRENMFFNEKLIWSYAIQMIRGLKALHDKKIMHRDIKSANIFLIKDKHQCKIGDMNVSKVIKEKVLKTQTGTPYYASPEVWKDEPYSYKSDLWSIGCVIYELCNLRTPFKGKNIDELYRNVIKGKFEKINNNYSNDLWKMILMLLQVDVKKRCDCDQFLNSKLIVKKMKELRENNFDLDFRLMKKNKSNMDGGLLKTIKFKDIKDIKAQLPQKKNYDSTKKIVNTKNYFKGKRLNINSNINGKVLNKMSNNSRTDNNVININTIINNKYYMVDLNNKNIRSQGSTASLCNNINNSNISKKNNQKRPNSNKKDSVGLNLDNLGVNNYNSYHKNNKNNNNKNEKINEDSKIKKKKDNVEKNNILNHERQKEKDRLYKYNKQLKEENGLKEKQIIKILNSKKSKNARYRSQFKENSKRLLRNQTSTRYLDYQNYNSNITKNNNSKEKENRKPCSPSNKYSNKSSILVKNKSTQQLKSNEKIDNTNNRNMKLFKCNSSINYMENLNTNNFIINKNKKNNIINKGNKNLLKRELSVKTKSNEICSVSPKKNLNLRINNKLNGSNKDNTSASYMDKKNNNKKNYRNKKIAEMNLNKYNSNNISKKNYSFKTNNHSSFSSSKNTSRPKRKFNTNQISNSNIKNKKNNNSKENFDKNINKKYTYQFEYNFNSNEPKKKLKRGNSYDPQKRKNDKSKGDITEPELLMMINPIKLKEPLSNYHKKPLNVSVTSINNSIKNMDMDNNFSENNVINRQKSLVKYIGQINVNGINNNQDVSKKNFSENTDINNIIKEGNEKKMNEQNKIGRHGVYNNFYSVNTVNNPVDKPVKLINIIK